MMLFRAFSVRSVNEIKPARLSGGAVAGCGLLCAKPGTFIHDLARIDGLSIDLPHNGALFLNKEHPVPLSCTMNIPRLLFVSLKINHVDYQAALYDSAFPLHAENVFFQLIWRAAEEGRLDLFEAVDRMVNTMLSDSIQLSGCSAALPRPEEALGCGAGQLYSALYHYLDSNLQNDITVPQLASAAGCSVRQLNAYLRKHSHCCGCEFISQYRISCAKQYLLSTSMTVTEIAEMVGFKSIHYFSRVFKRAEGVPPQIFRRDRTRGSAATEPNAQINK